MLTQVDSLNIGISSHASWSHARTETHSSKLTNDEVALNFKVATTEPTRDS